MPRTDAERILDLRQELNEHAFRYYVLSSPTISDADYDKKFRELLELEKEHPELNDPTSPTMRVGSPVPTGMKKVRHKVRMLSLDNVNNLAETLAFFSEHEGEEATLEMKIDGLSLHLVYKEGRLVQAITRGDGSEGEDVTENARTVRNLPLKLLKPVNIDVRGEIYWPLSLFHKFNASLDESDRYSNPRNAASGLIRQKDSRKVAKCTLSFVAYSVPTDLPSGVTTQEALLEYLETLGFATPTTLPVTRDMAGLPTLTCALTAAELEPAIRFLEDYKKSLDLDTDGLVIKLSSIEAQRDVGEGTRAPRWAAAYKFPPETKATRLINVVVQVGKTGQITPVAQLEPVNLGGAMVQKASLCNQDELNRLGIDIGDYVYVQRSGEVIPKIIGLARPSPTKADPTKSYQLPKCCPCCASPLVREEEMVHLYCQNPECFDQLFARLVYAVSKEALDIDGCGENAVRLLMTKNGVRKLSDLFALQEISVLKPAAKAKFLAGREKAKQAPLWRKLAALSIDKVGKETCQKLATRYDTISDMINDADGLKELIGDVASTNLRRSIFENIDELERLQSLGFEFIEDRKSAGPLSGKTFVITGTLVSGRRDEVSSRIEAKGGVVKGTVTKNVNYLVQGMDGGNNKAAAAKKWGTVIITEEELYSMMGEEMPLVSDTELLEEEP